MFVFTHSMPTRKCETTYLFLHSWDFTFLSVKGNSKDVLGGHLRNQPVTWRRNHGIKKSLRENSNAL